MCFGVGAWRGGQRQKEGLSSALYQVAAEMGMASDRHVEGHL